MSYCKDIRLACFTVSLVISEIFSYTLVALQITGSNRTTAHTRLYHRRAAVIYPTIIKPPSFFLSLLRVLFTIYELMEQSIYGRPPPAIANPQSRQCVVSIDLPDPAPKDLKPINLRPTTTLRGPTH